MAALHVNKDRKKPSLRIVLLSLALIACLLVSAYTTTAGLFATGTDQTVKLTGGDTLTITLGSGTGAYAITPGVDVKPSATPTVGVDANQPACYIFVKLTEANDTNGIVSASIDTGNFKKYESTDYYYVECAAKTAKTVNVLTGDKITVSTDATLDQIQAATTTNITYTISACGVQSKNITLAQAYNVAKGQI